MLLLNPRRTRTNMKLLQLVWIFLLTLCGQSGAASKPWVKNVTETEDGVLLQCEVFGASPELKVFWKNSTEHDVPAEERKTKTGGGYNITLQTNVTKTDTYTCVTTEGKKDDEVSSVLHVTVTVKSSASRIVPAAVVGVLAAVGVLGLVPAAVVGVLGLVAAVVV